MSSLRKLTRQTGYRIPSPLASCDAPELVNILSRLEVTPPDWLDFLLEYNGGSFEECLLAESPLGPLVVAEFLSVDRTRQDSLSPVLNYFRKEIHPQLIPFASDPGGNYFALMDNQADGPVFFWDHERNQICDLGLSFAQLLMRLEHDH